MQPSGIVQNGTTLNINFKNPFIDDGKGLSHSEISPEYIICGLVNIQVKTSIFKLYDPYRGTYKYSHIITVKIYKIFKSDKLYYEIKLSSKILQIENKLYRTDDLSSENLNWQLVKDTYESDRFMDIIDLTVFTDIHNTNTGLFRELYEDNDLLDFELRGKDGAIGFHRTVLASYSPVMKTMLSGQWKEVNAGALEVSETSKATLQQLKDFMYMRKLPDTGIEQLAKLAAYYLMADLQQCCAFKMIVTLTADNAAERLEFALKYKIKKLFLAILAMIKSNQFTIEDIENKLFDDDD